MRRFEQALFAGEAQVSATQRGLADLRGLGAAVARGARGHTARWGCARDAADPMESVDQAAGQLLRLAPGVEVLRPARLRSAIVERLRRAGAAYGLRS